MNELFPREPHAFGINFVGDGQRVHDFVKALPSSEMAKRVVVSLPIPCACTVCNMACSLDIPLLAMDGMMGRIMEGKPITAHCPGCRAIREIRPLSPKELAENQFYIFRRNYEIRMRETSLMESLPVEIKQFMEEYEKQLHEEMDRRGVKPVAYRPEDAEQGKGGQGDGTYGS